MASAALRCFALLVVLGLVSAATVTYDFKVGWLTANPDGAFERKTIGINDQWPIPPIVANLGDTVVVNVENQLGDQATSLHFHGLFQNGTTNMDGPAGVTQCPIPPGGSMTYNFTINQPGTYWYHAHNAGQYPDGLRGPLIVHDPDSPHKDEFDEEFVLTFSDWYHDQMTDLIAGFLAKTNPSGAEPVPQSALMNETQNLKIKVETGKTYLFRMINIGAFAAQYIWFEGHTMQIVEVDGVYTEKAEADMIYLSAAQRCSVLIKTKDNTDANFAVVGSMDTNLFDAFSPDLNYNVTGWLVYDESKPLPPPALVDALEPFDDMNLVPFDKEPLFSDPERTVQLDVVMDNLRDGANYAFFNNITYKRPNVPTLYTVMSTGEMAANPLVYGSHTNSFVLEKDQTIEIVVNNLDPGRHPFHLHGHNFQVVHRSPEEGGTFADEGVQEADLPETPMRRDTVVVWPNGNLVLRFRSDNPGIWLFHCHIEWHVASGLVATFVEAPLDIQKNLQTPQNHLDACAKAGIATKGNAAGNTVDLLDLTGENGPPKRLPDGFTPRGIVAFVFSWIAGILGLCVVAWYGFSDPGDDAPAGVKKRVAAADVDGAAEENAPATVEVTATSGSGTKA